MTDPQPSAGTKLPLINLLPNLLTLTAIIAGLTAIRFGVQGDFERAVRLILLAGILDGLDGRLARLLKCQSQTGAELDSLADFLNFGVAPALIIYFWALHDLPGAGWLAVLAYAICCVLRLARFNVSSKSNVPDTSGDFFEGVPSPAGALLVMLPMFVSFVFSDLGIITPVFMAVYMVIVGLLMISRIPTYSFKKVVISRDSAKYYLLACIVLISALLTYLWATLVVLCLVYIGGLFWAARLIRSKSK